jgi:CubicO group peptidase (beta-lactamase class C family)
MRPFCFAFLTLAVPATLEAQVATDTFRTAVDRIFDGFRSTDGPGCAVAYGSGINYTERAYGMANLETGTPIRPSTIFHVASVSKQFTAMAILLLEREGKLSLDDDIRKHLAEIPNYGHTVTIRHLLNHTSGLRDQWDLLSMARGRFEENRITEADVMDIVPRQKALNFTPGSEYLYSNTGYTLAAIIVKRVSGKSLRQFAHERIFHPLSMTQTHFHDDYTMIVPGRAMAYAPRQGGGGLRVSIPNYDTYGATSLFTTVGDLMKWEANFEDPIVGDRAMFDTMQTSGVLTTGDTTGYALGLAVGQYRGRRLVEHGGSDAGYRSWVGRFPVPRRAGAVPESRLTIAIACNSATANPSLLGRRIADAHMFASSNPAAEVSPQGIAVPAAEIEKREGVYFHPATVAISELIFREGKLFQGRTGTNELVPVGENRFRTSAGNEFVFAPDARAGFELRRTSGPRLTYERKDTMVISKAALQPYAGTYYSEELNATYRVVTTDTSITLQTGTSEPFRVRPVFADAFVGRYTVLFTRSGKKITGFELTSGRSRRVKFRRLSS